MGLDASQAMRLAQAAIEARKRAYAPYSNFFVGAALQLEDGQLVTAGNVENASYGLTLCAERAALVSAVARGATKDAMQGLAVAVDAPVMAAPCGACRQVLLELCPQEMPVWLVNVRDETKHVYTVAQLLPHAFDAHALAP